MLMMGLAPVKNSTNVRVILIRDDAETSPLRRYGVPIDLSWLAGRFGCHYPEGLVENESQQQPWSSS